MKTPRILWKPSVEFREQTNLFKFGKWLKEQKGLLFTDYDALWKWSVDDISAFWQSIWEYFEILHDGNFKEVFTGEMPQTRWFEGTQVNYAEHVFRNYRQDQPAVIFYNESGKKEVISWQQLRMKVAKLAQFMRERGVKKGDRVVAYIPNIPEATIGFLAANSLGAIWSSCSPDFGVSSVVSRFQQIEPVMLLTTNGYIYSGKQIDRRKEVKLISEDIPSLKTIIEIPILELETLNMKVDVFSWAEAGKNNTESLPFTRVPFNDPIWVLYSSGTTGKPKAITHSTGGVLLEHYKYVALHNNVKAGEVFFWFTTTGWMMWNYTHATMLTGATIVLFDGSPAYPEISTLWSIVEQSKINHFGTSAPFIMANLKRAFSPRANYNLSSLQSISSTGSPLPKEGFDWIYENVKEDVWLVSMSGGTDVCTAFVGGNPEEPVIEGEIQRPALGCDLDAFDEMGASLREEVGEMVIKKPMPSMPVFFWNDPKGERYKESYFDYYEGIWRHGDWIKITSRGSLIIYGRSDATLNRQGVRIGTAEIYDVVDQFSEIEDSLVVNIETAKGNDYMPLFVKMAKGSFNEELKNELINKFKAMYSPRHIPDNFVQVEEIPYTLSGKKMESPVKKILMGVPKSKAATIGAMRNPESLDFFMSYYQSVIKAH